MKYDEECDPKSAAAIFRLPDIKRRSGPRPEEEINWAAEEGRRHSILLSKCREEAQQESVEPPPVPRPSTKISAVAQDLTLLDSRTFAPGRCPFGEGDPIAILDEYIRVVRFTHGVASIYEVDGDRESLRGALDIASGEVLFPISTR